jgi:glycosyltransferase involved in cell wall biosynthesis
MVVDGETGALVPPHDASRLAAAISSLLRDAELRARLGDGGRARCEERFTLRAHVDAVVEQYRALLATCATTSA